MSKQLKIKHAIAFSLIFLALTSFLVMIYFLQIENQDLKTQQDSLIKVTKTEKTEYLCPVNDCELEETISETPIEKKYNTLAGLFTEYTVEYPLGWHVIDSGLDYFEQDEINTVYVHFNNQPITQVPRGGQLGKIALIDQSGQIPTLEKFLTEKKSLFQNLTEETITTNSGLTAHKLSGQTMQYEEWMEELIYILEYTDSVGDRHLLYTSIQISFDDSETAQSDLAVLEHIIKSFQIKE